ncbi:MAG: DUF1109 domain-containing protein [Rhodopseudomonas sp.]|uniref:DUF1109 domain-containing protein n=1 Tax=Rhodopseudomonas sp. TaxID=1078 RepID=UPI0017B610C4|nr:DUF1109 domain-containing protein [Rhodopseudomonas sp.]NVN87087.1 DUF1109 domain-containing protein [Rhodopseudomonas sp.]
MDTDRLIQSLAADAGNRAMPVAPVLAASLLVAIPVSAAMLLSTIGLRPDIMTAMHNPFFDLKFVVTLALAMSAVAVSLHLSRPEASAQGWILLLLIPVAVLALAIGAEMMVPQRQPMMRRLVGNNAMLCVSTIPLLSLPLLAAALLALRRGAPARPALAGALAGLVSAGLAATLYAAHCNDDSPLFVAAWYTLSAALVAAIGALAGAKLLRY